MPLWDKALSFFVGEAAGGAAGKVVEPAFEPTRQNSWARRPYAVLEAELAAEIRTKGIPSAVDLEDDALRNGVGPARWDLLVEAVRTYPGLAEAIELWRRDLIGQEDFTKAMRRHGFGDEWVGHLSHLKDEHLTPAQIALGIVRSLLPDPNFLPVDLKLSGGQVPAYGVSSIDPVAEAAKHGIDRERLRVMVGEIGLPMALDSAASSVFRGIINRADFNRAVLEGDTRPEWADAIFEHARQIPSVADYVNAHIRGWITEKEMHDGAARHGMSADDTDLLYLRTGRPAAPGQMATAAARGIKGPDGVPMNREQFLKGIKESDIRPEWGEMLWETRFLYPPLFQITRLVQAGAITAETAREWAVKDRYPPEVVGPLYDYWKQPTAAKADTHEAKAQTQLWGTLHRAFMAGDVTDAQVTTKLPQAGVSAATVPTVLATWKHEREIQRQRITPAQLKKAWQKAVANPASGSPWTKEDVLAELLSRGWSSQDANTFLDTPTGK